MGTPPYAVNIKTHEGAECCDRCAILAGKLAEAMKIIGPLLQELDETGEVTTPELSQRYGLYNPVIEILARRALHPSTKENDAWLERFDK